MDAGILVVGMDLDGEVAVRVENLGEQREAVALGMTEQLVVLVPKLGERGAANGPLTTSQSPAGCALMAQHSPMAPSGMS